jgi:DNA-binding XRE family transcriptional regulator
VSQIHIREGKLQEICEDLDCSRDDLARRLGVSSAAAFRIDSGRVRPSTKFIGALIEFTGRRFEDLFEVREDVA